MGVSNSKNRPIVLARCKTPGYCIKTVGSRHVLLAGGGGSSKTGVANEIELMLLSYSTFSQDQEKRESRDISSPLIADRICSINTNPHATMNMDVACIAAPASGRYLIATGHDQYCDLYESTGFTLTDPAKKTGKLSLDFKKIARIVADRAASSPYQKVVRFDKSEAVTFENSRKMYTGGADGYIRIWNVESIRKTKEKDPQPMLEISAHHGDVNDLDISADAKTLLSVGHDAKTFLWDAITGCKIFEVEIPESLESRCRPRSVRFTTLGSENLTFVVSYNHIIRSPKSRSYLSLWICNREKNICKHVVLSEACGEAISAMAISECGIYTAIGTIGGSIGIYDTHEMKPLYFARETHSIFVTDIEFLSRHAVDFTPPNRSQLKNANTGVVSEHRAAVISLSADQTVQLHAIPYIRTSFFSFLPLLSVSSAAIYYFLWYTLDLKSQISGEQF